jgi:hypothetical protein
MAEDRGVFWHKRANELEHECARLRTEMHSVRALADSRGKRLTGLEGAATDRAALVEQVAHYKRLADDRGAEVVLLSDKLAAALRQRDGAQGALARVRVLLTAAVHSSAMNEGVPNPAAGALRLAVIEALRG